MVTKKGRDEIKWKVLEQSHPEKALEERSGLGLHGMDVHHLPKNTIFAQMLFYNMFLIL